LIPIRYLFLLIAFYRFYLISVYIFAYTLQISSSINPYYCASYCRAFIFSTCFVGAVLQIAFRFFSCCSSYLSTNYFIVIFELLSL